MQRCLRATVSVGGRPVGGIGAGLVAFVGVGRGDGLDDVRYAASKLAGLRIFPGADGRMALPGEACLLIPNFTLYGDVRRGRRPDFFAAAPPEEAQALFDRLVAAVDEAGLEVAAGVFGADMRVDVANDGPVTLLLDSRRQF